MITCGKRAAPRILRLASGIAALLGGVGAGRGGNDLVAYILPR